jgi:hypothetical protein
VSFRVSLHLLDRMVCSTSREKASYIAENCVTYTRRNTKRSGGIHTKVMSKTLESDRSITNYYTRKVAIITLRYACQIPYYTRKGNQRSSFLVAPLTSHSFRDPTKKKLERKSLSQKKRCTHPKQKEFTKAKYRPSILSQLNSTSSAESDSPSTSQACTGICATNFSPCLSGCLEGRDAR